MTTWATQERPITEWLGVLDDIGEVVSRRLAATEAPAPAGDGAAPAQTPLQILDDRLAQMRARLEQAERDAREADEVLRAEAEAHQRWTEAMAAARRGLAECARRA